ncbi:hypothetical protein [Mycobacterium ostraviense]|uniref:hypothetical protein n=1 Tax=Mycobacterium ostraviense TaxID=2738409 RepID=UPI000A59D4F3|nr:hypothetical protein [Mycobacterium ostraviense]UGT90729.1 hypothetical protein LTS72_21060 [Mycobacterium ostraviense]
MTVDPVDEFGALRRARDAALAAETGDELVDAYEQGAIMMAWSQVVGQMPTLTDTLRVTILGADDIDSYTVGTVSRAFQNAVARVDKATRRPTSTALSLTRRDRERAELVQQAQVGNTVYFRVPAVPLSPGGYDIGIQSGRAGAAIRELVETLPASADDEESAKGILGASRLLRLAVQDISNVAALVPEGLELDLETSAEEIKSVLTRDRAAKLLTFLGNRDTVEDTETVVGKLDGFRGTRRVFYLIKDDNSEIAGSIEGDLLSTVRNLVGTRVRARVSTTRWRAQNGRLGPKHYGLLDLMPAGEQEAMFSDG